ncbi:MAG: hypothetical protein ACI9VS_000472 [Candidatus Binatia bacterium]
MSRRFVCVRLDSYESEKHQEWVRHFLGGRFENSVFAILSPNGQDWLSRSSRGPNQVFGSDAGVISSMTAIADRYSVKGDPAKAVVEDFHSVRQALNVASADQRVLALVAGSGAEIKAAKESLRAVASHKDVIGRFHFDFDSGYGWRDSIKGEESSGGIFLIRPGEFGMDGEVMAQLAFDAGTAAIRAALEKARVKFAATTKKKVYSEHVARGGKLGIYFEGNVEYGEDRDGDGQVDRGRGGGGRSGQRR